jgi:hypothetical protein
MHAGAVRVVDVLVRSFAPADRIRSIAHDLNRVQ